MTPRPTHTSDRVQWQLAFISSPISLFFLIFAIGIAASPSAAQVLIGDKVYTKKDSRQATRDAFLASLRAGSARWSAWRTLAPFDHPPGDGDIAAPFPPEEEIPRMFVGGPGPDTARQYAGKGGSIGWREVNQRFVRTDGSLALDLRDGVPNTAHQSVAGYVYGVATCETDTDVGVAVGSDDGLRLWVNGQLLIDVNAARSLDPNAHVLTLRLKAGVNHIFAKVSQGGGEWDFTFAEAAEMDPFVEAALEYQLDTDFPDAEAPYYRLVTIPQPRGVSLEVGGLDVLADGRLIACTRRGDIFVISNTVDQPAMKTEYLRFAQGLQEPLGLAVRTETDSGGRPRTRIYVAQRSELTRLEDTTGDGIADVYETLCADWKISGNYHEYAFGPKFDRDGNAWVTLNLAHLDGESVMGATLPSRGCAVKITPDGVMQRFADGLRSPDGLGMYSDGAMFYTDNQGDWVGTNKLSWLAPGSFHGHEASLRFRDGFGASWKANGVKRPEVMWPAIWFPYRKMGQSASDVLLYQPGLVGSGTMVRSDRQSDAAGFGPFEGQLFVGELTLAQVNRVFLEKITGKDGTTVYQGACFPFRSGFASGVHRLAWGTDGSMYVGMTDRGWGSTGPKREGVQRMVFTGRVPLEIQTMSVRPDGFVLTFTLPVPDDVLDVSRYRMTSYTYAHHSTYGSDEMETREVAVRAVERLDGRTVRVCCDGLRDGGCGFVHELTLSGVKSVPAADGPPEALLHDKAYYTVQRLPAAE